AAIQVVLRLGEEAPVVRAAQELRPGRRNAHEPVLSRGARFEEHHTGARILRQAAGEKTPGGARADDDVVVRRRNLARRAPRRLRVAVLQRGLSRTTGMSRFVPAWYLS